MHICLCVCIFFYLCTCVDIYILLSIQQFIHCLFFPVLEPTSVKCNETTFLNSSGPSLYLHYVTDTDQTSSPSPKPTPTSTSYPSVSMTTPAPTDAGVTTPFCPPAFTTQRGQRIDVTLYSFGQYRAYDSLVSTGGSESYHHLRPCPSSVYVIDEGRRHSSALCQARHREQHIYTTNSSRAAVYFGRSSGASKQHQVTAQKSFGNFLVRLQGIMLFIHSFIHSLQTFI